MIRMSKRATPALDLPVRRIAKAQVAAPTGETTV